MFEQPSLTGPEMLDAMADIEFGDAREINGQAFRRLAQQWRDDRRVLSEAAHRIGTLERRLTAATKALAA